MIFIIICLLFDVWVFLIAGVAPFPGATTGTGGRIRDVQSTGRGAHVVAGTAGLTIYLRICSQKIKDPRFSKCFSIVPSALPRRVKRPFR